MPKIRPMTELRTLGREIRARRLHLGRTREAAAISIVQLRQCETGQDHPPAFTLHRIASTLGTSTSALLGEETTTENAEQIREFTQIYSHPVVGAVVRYMCEMKKNDRDAVRIIAAAFASRQRKASYVDKAGSNQTPLAQSRSGDAFEAVSVRQGRIQTFDLIC